MDSAGDEMDDEVSEEDDGDGGLDMASILLLFLMSSGFGFLCFGIGEIKVHFGGMKFRWNFRDTNKNRSLHFCYLIVLFLWIHNTHLFVKHNGDD